MLLACAPTDLVQQILRAASQCFGTRGFHGTTTRDVAAAVGITEAALYRYFPSKEAMYTAILDARMSAPNPVDAVAEPAARGDDRAVFAGLLETLLASVASDPSFIRLLFYSALEGHELAKPFHEQRMRRMRDSGKDAVYLSLIVSLSRAADGADCKAISAVRSRRAG